ncbi:MAG: prepilin-type N-terminal cleavage/methylation domain-containing protein [Syntrophomonadaceae bacterium]|nr:prepilin-type N-terminal cleavage/methylation domain-containing protein [Syntrophomonadaceae bacterium]
MCSFIKINKNRGFTLVELVIVMAILAVLAALAIPKYTSVLSEAKAKSDQTNVKLLQDAIDLYYAENGEYPATLNDLEPDYIKEVPTQQHPTANQGDSFSYNSATGEVSDPNT